MKVITVTVIVLRLFALYWAFMGLITTFVSVLATGPSLQLMLKTDVWKWLQVFLPLLVYFGLAGVTWVCAGALARRLVPNSDFQFHLQVEARDLYGLGILIVGLSTFLTHLAGALNWVHYLIANRAGEDLVGGKSGSSLYAVSKEVIPCMVGAALAFGASRLGARLAKVPPAGSAEQPSEASNS
jgi:hypothetical protein